MGSVLDFLFNPLSSRSHKRFCIVCCGRPVVLRNPETSKGPPAYMFNPISGPFKQTFILYDFYTLYCRGPPISADLIILRQDRLLATAVLSSAPATPPTPHGSLLRRRFNLELLMNSIGIVQVGILVLLFSYDSCGINIL